ncbi:cation/H(+) antiporter 15 isoform X2 [Cajanus cajan]|uniref:cation/H(+) antiporter 15 isoform X2 n=1 Tax=Cajanus cajan TaxID=3821 RepID=UPI0010FB5FC0|nr:cation/H(+) antiporter 15 isoform X2 [Cajanus cajan]
MVNTISNTTFSLNTSIWICEDTTLFQSSKGIFFGENPLNFVVLVVILQGSLVCFTNAWLEFILMPLGETTFVSQAMAGFLMGPSVLGQFKCLKKFFFAPKPFFVCETISLLGTMIFLFSMGVKIDISMVMRTGRKTWAIGVCSFVLPLAFSIFYAFLLRQVLPPGTDIYKSLFYIAAFSSAGSFQVVANLLEDFKLLNSEVGRLAISSSMVNGVLCAIWQIIAVSRQQKIIFQDTYQSSSKWIAISLCVMVIIILCVLRPIMLWMIRRTPKGRPMKESYLVSVYVMVLGCSLFGEFIGEHYLIGPIILGLAVPEGPPLGSALPVAFFGFLGKVIGTMLPSIYCNMPLTDALILGLIMGAQGMTHILHFQNLQYLHIIDDQSYAQMVVALMWLTAASTPIVKFMYDPTKSYLSLNRRRTIEHAPPRTILPLMACIYHEENTPPLINVLEMSNSSTESPICLYVLHLIQLTGRSAPVLIDHEASNKSVNPLKSSYSQNIRNAFKSYENQQMGNVMVKVLTSISPYETMHDEICLQAAKKRAYMLIVPFHKQCGPTQILESAQPIRALNRHLLRTAPCSVGILVERGNLISNNPLTSMSFYSVGILFVEGADDREALAYAMRMADHPNVKVTVIRLMEPRRKSRNLASRDPDGDLIHKFMVDYIHIKRHDYREEAVRDSVEMVNVIRSLEGCYDLILVGRRHQNESSLFSGLTEWIEFPELGLIADMLVSSDSTFDGSVLVVQQQNKAGIGLLDIHPENSIVKKQEPLPIVEVTVAQRRDQ